nr:MAG TPA: hypothetical protein [Caudoviricetes sp.]
MQKLLARVAVTKITKTACFVRVAMLRGRARGFAWVRFVRFHYFLAVGSLRMCAAIDALIRALALRR